MPFLTGNIEFKVYTDTDQTEFPTQLFPSLSKDFTDDAVTEIQSTTLTLAALGAQTISFNGVGTVKRFYIYSSATDINLNINGLGDILFMGQEPGYVPATLSSLVITNADAALATTVTLVMIAS